MEKPDFDELTVRRGTGSMKWDTVDDPEVIPLWVADMDFRTAPAVTEALMRRVESGIFGYTEVPAAFYEALDGWFTRRHGWSIARESVIYTSGVVPAISAIIKALTIPGDGVIVNTPAYNCFFSSIRNNGCRQIDAPLLRCGVEDCEHSGPHGGVDSEGFTFRMDFGQLEEVAADPRNRLMILCNPHNPTGRVWTRAELEKVRDICRRHDVTVVSDEIHCELTHGSIRYTPYATVDDSAIVCVSPSKAFNTAGLQIAAIVCPDERVRARIDRAINDNEVCDVNPFGVAGLIAAYTRGEEWLEELRGYLDGNYARVREVIATQMPGWRVCDSEATYLAWVDVSGTGEDGDTVAGRLLREAKVRVSPGSDYGAPQFIRINYACPRGRLDEALQRMSRLYK